MIKNHIPALDGIRGCAALVVVVQHAFQLDYISGSPPAGYFGVLGVSVFFALSGFLMAFLYLGEVFRFRTTIDYSVSRIARIAPAYLLVVLVCWVITRFVDPNFIFAITKQNIVRHLFFSGSVGVFWSIPPEVQFYAFFLLIWYSWSKARSGNYMPFAFTTLLCIAMITLSGGLPGTFLPTKLSFFLSGTTAGVVARYVQSRVTGSRWVFLVQVIMLCIVASYALVLCRQSYEALYSSIPYSILCGVLILSLSIQSDISKGIFGSRVMVFIGKISFALYLVHFPCLYALRKAYEGGYVANWAALAMAVALSVGLSTLIHVAVERPAQRRIKRLARVKLFRSELHASRSC